MNINTRALSVALPLRSVAMLTAALAVLVVFAYWPTSGALWSYWTTAWGADQGLFIAAISVWLLFRSRVALARAPAEPALWAAPLVMLTSIASIIFWKAGIQELQLLLFPLLMLSAILTAFGPSVARIALVPFGFLYFAMPAWSVLAVPLQHLTLSVVAAVAPALGLPASVTGTLVSFPSGATFEVTRDCGGAVFFVQSLAVATLIGELEDATLRRRALLLGSVAVLALVANWARVLALIYIGYTTEMRHVIVARDHVLFGWVLFALVLVAFAWAVARRAPPAAAVSQVPPAPPKTQTQRLRGYVTAVAALASIPLLVYVLGLTHDAEASEEFQLPPGIMGWHGPTALHDDTWVPVFVGPHRQWHVSYVDQAGRPVETVAIGYAKQEQGRELVNEGNSLLGRGALIALDAGLVSVGDQRYIEETLIDGQGKRSVVWYLYDIGGRAFVIPFFSQLWYGVRSLGAAPYSALLAFRSGCDSSCSQARETLGDFARQMGPGFLATFRQETPP